MPSYQRTVTIPNKSGPEIYAKISTEIDRFLEKYTGSFGKFDVNCDPQSQSVTLKSNMATAKLICGEGQVVLDANLSFLATPFKSKIDDWINRWLAKTFQI